MSLTTNDFIRFMAVAFLFPSILKAAPVTAPFATVAGNYSFFPFGQTSGNYSDIALPQTPSNDDASGNGTGNSSSSSSTAPWAQPWKNRGNGTTSANTTTKTMTVTPAPATAAQHYTELVLQRCATVADTNATRESDLDRVVQQRHAVLKAKTQAKANIKAPDDIKFKDLDADATNDVGPTTAASEPFEIPVHFHVITDGVNGYLDTPTIARQMDRLNADYASTGFNFSLASTSYSVNADWFNGAMSSWQADVMKSSLRQGGPEALNVYTVDFHGIILGTSSFPWSYEDYPAYDGVIFDYNTVPGGAFEGYNMGRTATHEVGHWLGLYHTFQGGDCEGPGDFVADTPAEAVPNTGCPLARDTCQGDQLLDPIHNFLDYSTDDCMDQFTTGQAMRMQAAAVKYRGL